MNTQLFEKECRIGTLAVFALLAAGCNGRGSVPPPIGLDAITLGQPAAYLGFSAQCYLQHLPNCLRGPANGTTIAVSQTNNSSSFSVTSSQPAVVGGTLIMQGPGGVGNPAIQLEPLAPGTATIKIGGSDGLAASLPVSVTTVSTMTVTLNGLPSAQSLYFTVAAPPSPDCTGFASGYSFGAAAPSPGSNVVVIGNFPALGNGPSPACVFSTVTVAADSASGEVLAQKTVQFSIALNQDNPESITLP